MPDPIPPPESPAVRLRSVRKTYYPPEAFAGGVKDAFVSLFGRRDDHPPVEALRGIDLEIARGTTVGIVGANGSGKSTLLKTIAGVSCPDSGTVEVSGRLVGLVELGAGFHPDLTGEENVRLQGAIHGLPDRVVAERLDAVFAYAELADFRATELKHYSSGMIARLGFAVAIQCDPDVLLVDEVLAVGDHSFQERCLATIDELRRAGKTVVFVTHNMEFAERLCERLVWLRGGRIVADGPALETLQEYHRAILSERYSDSEGPLTPERVLVDEPGRFGTGGVRFEDVRTCDAEGRPRRNFRPGEPLTIELRWRREIPVEALDFSLTITFEDGNNVAYWSTRDTGDAWRDPPERGTMRLRIPAPGLLPGDYIHSPAVSPAKPPPEGDDHFDLHLRVHRFAVLGGGGGPGVPLDLAPRATWSAGAASDR